MKKIKPPPSFTSSHLCQARPEYQQFIFSSLVPASWTSDPCECYPYNPLFYQSMENHQTMLSLQEQINAHQYSYPDQGVKPCAYFWKEILQGKDTPRVLVPDTLIINLKETPLLWVYTNSQGKLQANSNISLKDFVAKVTNYCSPNELVTTLKRLVNKNEPNNYGHDVRVVNSRYLHNLSLQQLGDNVITIQKYIKSHGKHAFICRTVFTQKSHPHCFLITNKPSYYDIDIPENKRFLVTNTHSSRDGSKMTIAKSATGRHLNETLPMLEEIVNYLRFQRGVKVTELVGDFVKDQEGHWWLTNIKALKVQEKAVGLTTSISMGQLRSTMNEKEKYQRTKQCRYCQVSYLESELTHKMTKKMIVQMDRYLLHLGRDYDWLSRSDVQVDCHSLYQQSKVCQRCYRLYLQIQALLSFEGQFLHRLSVTTEAEPKDLLMRLTSKQELQVQSKDKEIVNLKHAIPEEISLGPNSSIITRQDRPLRNDQTIHEMVRYRFLIYLHELDQLTGICPHTNYYLDFGLFGARFKIKLDLRPNMSSSLIKKLRVCYFFFPAACQNQNLHEYVQKHEVLKINLVAEKRESGEKRIAGKLALDLKEFLVQGRKSFYKFLDAEGGFGWGLEGSIGLVRNEKEVNTSRLILSTEDRLVYLPSQHYYICQPLPEDWITEIMTKNRDKSHLQSTIKSNDCMRGVMAETNQQFIPEKTFYKKPQTVKKVDWGGQLKKELKQYEKRVLKVLQ